jgi:hypothetical protein
MMNFELVKLLLLASVIFYIFYPYIRDRKKLKAININGKFQAIYQMPFEKNSSLLIVTEQMADNTIISKSMFRAPLKDKVTNDNIKILSSTKVELVTEDLVTTLHEAVLKKHLLAALSDSQEKDHIIYLNPYPKI